MWVRLLFILHCGMNSRLLHQRMSYLLNSNKSIIVVCIRVLSIKSTTFCRRSGGKGREGIYKTYYFPRPGLFTRFIAQYDSVFVLIMSLLSTLEIKSSVYWLIEKNELKLFKVMLSKTLFFFLSFLSVSSLRQYGWWYR